MVVDKERLGPYPSGSGSIEGLGSDPGVYGTPEIIRGSIYGDPVPLSFTE